ncbi:angiotensin-converting enzyme-like [Diadema antillarum]|uniref:angiotensin-converting enzyme-like n=1 Tax=Diadema antillarum TaxID=105358 RepID=UPI003A848065
MHLIINIFIFIRLITIAYHHFLQSEESLKAASFDKKSAAAAREFDGALSTFPDDVTRQLTFISQIGVSTLDNQTVAEFNRLTSEMSETYSTATVCRPEQPWNCVTLDPDLSEIMASSTDWDELVWAWKGFRDAVGVPNKPLYAKYVDIANQGARENGYEDMGHSWRSEYGDDVKEKVQEIYEAILPLYKQLHAYVRRKLHNVYGDRIDVKGYLPAHVFGEMWGRFWDNIYNLVVPYPDRPNIDVTDTMNQQGYNATTLFEMANEFYVSMGLLPVRDEFWENSMFVKPDDGRDVVCHPSAWDLFDNNDVRISICTEITMRYFLIAHHELGHIQYFMQYEGQPVAFRDGANGAFHEAIGEVMSLSVATPKHLQEVGLFEGLEEGDFETDINFLLKTSLTTIATLPFSLGLSRWRWDLMSGVYDVNNSMARWWQLKRDLVGVEPPVPRSENDFDPGAMDHFITHYPFIGYYIRTILQFQFYKAMCDAANHEGPLHRCDFYQSREAGTLLGDMMSMGRSRPWQEAMEVITGQREMSADAILEYFQPLMEWLERTNAENGEQIGWDSHSGKQAEV